jgi:thiol-disulfide isomerase/thioredoxin
MNNIEELLNTNSALAVYFKGPDCGVCEALLSKVDKLFTDKFDKVRFEMIDISKDQKSASKFLVLTFPTLLVFFDKKEYLRYSRHISIHQIENDLKRIYDIYF